MPNPVALETEVFESTAEIDQPKICQDACFSRLSGSRSQRQQGLIQIVLAMVVCATLGVDV